MRTVFRYKGQWNEVARYPNNFQEEEGQCNRATYTDRDEISVKVNNTQIIERDGVREANGAFGQAAQEIVSCLFWTLTIKKFLGRQAKLADSDVQPGIWIRKLDLAPFYI